VSKWRVQKQKLRRARNNDKNKQQTFRINKNIKDKTNETTTRAAIQT